MGTTTPPAPPMQQVASTASFVAGAPGLGGASAHPVTLTGGLQRAPQRRQPTQRGQVSSTAGRAGRGCGYWGDKVKNRVEGVSESSVVEKRKTR